jgi:hypothetical protein
MTALFTPSVTDALLHLEAGAEALSEYRDYSLGVRDSLDVRWRANALRRTGLLPTVEPLTGLAGSATSIPFAKEARRG